MKNDRGDARRKQILEFIVGFKVGNDGNSPTFREISRNVGVAMSCVKYHIDYLERGNALKVKGNRFIVVGGQWLPPQPLDKSIHVDTIGVDQ